MGEPLVREGGDDRNEMAPGVPIAAVATAEEAAATTSDATGSSSLASPKVFAPPPVDHPPASRENPENKAVGQSI